MAKLQLLLQSRLSSNEILRKSIHISGFLIPLLYVQFFSLYVLSTMLFLVLMVYVTSEIARHHGMHFPLFSKLTQKATTSTFEKNRFVTAPISFTLGIVLSLLIFSTPIAYTSITILTLGDGFANIFGKIFGKNPIFFNKNKTIEGTIGGFICAFLGSIIFINPLKALIAVAAGMLVESVPLQINDNLAIPLSSGIVLTIIWFL